MMYKLRKVNVESRDEVVYIWKLKFMPREIRLHVYENLQNWSKYSSCLQIFRDGAIFPVFSLSGKRIKFPVFPVP